MTSKIYSGTLYGCDGTFFLELCLLHFIFTQHSHERNIFEDLKYLSIEGCCLQSEQLHASIWVTTGRLACRHIITSEKSDWYWKVYEKMAL